MIAWNEDCKLYSYTNTNFIDEVNALSPQIFENISWVDLTPQVIEIQYQWVDPIKIQDKIYGKEQREVTFWIFKQQSIVCCFGNSESGISYAISKLSERTSTIFKSINIFNICNKLSFIQNESLGKLITLHIKTMPIPSRHSDIVKINPQELSHIELEKYLSGEEITCLTFAFKGISFHLGLNSVISFFSTVIEEDIYLIIKNIIEVIEKKS